MTSPLPPDNETLARLFREAATLMELAGQSEHRVRAWGRIASALASLPQPAAELLAEGRLGDVPGIGGVTVGQVRELVRTGRLEVLEELRHLVPPTLLPLGNLPGITPGRLRQLWLALGVTTISDLELACRTNELHNLPGFGPKVQEAVLGALVRGAGWGRQRLLDAGRRAASRVLGRLAREPSAIRLGVAGAVRRMAPVVDQVHLLATAHDPSALLDAFVAIPWVVEIVSRDRGAVTAALDDGVTLHLEVAPDDDGWPCRVALATGPVAHTDALRSRSDARGLSLRPEGLFRDGNALPIEDEEALYAALEIPYVPPERRETTMPGVGGSEDLVSMADVQGVVQLHTRDGAGRFPLEAMVDRAEQESYAWCVVADRSRSAFPKGASLEAFAEQAETLTRIREETERIRAFHGIEVDVLGDGRLDAPDDLLDRVDLVIASVNDGHGLDGRPLDGAGMTRRILRAVEHPRVRVLAHPLGRVLLGRTAWSFDVEAVLDACARTGTAVQISGLPQRLDLDEAWHDAARDRGILAVPAADAHDLGGIDQAILAVASARRGGWTRSEIPTTLGADAFLAWCRA